MKRTLLDSLPQGGDNLYFKEEMYILDVAHAVLAQMELKNETITSMALSMQKTKGYLSGMLNGERNMTLRTIFRIAHALGINPLSPIVHPSLEIVKESAWGKVARAKSNVITFRPRTLGQKESTYKINQDVVAA